MIYYNGKPTTISVNGTPLPCPSSMNESIEDLHGESSRNAAGYLVSDIIRANVVKLELHWNSLSRADYQALKNALGGQMFKSVKFTGSNGETTITMYKGALTASPYRLLDTGEIQLYTDITVSLIQR